MTLRTYLMTGLAAATLGLTTPALAAPSQAAIDAVVAQLVAQGYSGEIRIRPSGDTLIVEASGASGRTERVYSGDGAQLFEEETRGADGSSVEREYDVSGKLVEEEYEAPRSDRRAERAKEEQEDRVEREEERAEDRREREEEEAEDRRERDDEKAEKRRERDDDDEDDDDDDDDDDEDDDD